jgi:hypothetical protein
MLYDGVVTINRQGAAEKLYASCFLDRVVYLWAISQGQANQRAIEHYRPKKNQKEAINTMLKVDYDRKL